MKRLVALLLILGLGLVAARAQFTGSPAFVALAFNYKHITTDTTTVVKSSGGLLGSICVNTTASTETITIYDNTAASGTVIGVITLGSNVGCFINNTVFGKGLTIVTAVAAGDLTVNYQ